MAFLTSHFCGTSTLDLALLTLRCECARGPLPAHCLKMLRTSQLSRTGKGPDPSTIYQVRSHRQSSETCACSCPGVRLRSTQTSFWRTKMVSWVTDHFRLYPQGELYNQDISSLFKAIHKTYGPIVLLKGILGRPDVVAVNDPEFVSQVRSLSYPISFSKFLCAWLTM